MGVVDEQNKESISPRKSVSRSKLDKVRGSIDTTLTVGETLALRRVAGHRYVGEPFYFYDDLTHGESMSIRGFKKLDRGALKEIEESLIRRGLLAMADDPDMCCLTELGDSAYEAMVVTHEKTPWRTEIKHGE